MINAVDRELNIENLRILSSRMAHMEYFLGFGTLLGFVRNGTVIEDDDDIDFFIDVVYFQDIKDILEELGYEIRYLTEGIFMQGKRKLAETDTFSDFYFYERKDGYILERWNFSGQYKNPNNHIHIPDSIIFPIKESQFGDMMLKMPFDEISLCKYLYGPRYLEPMSKRLQEYSVNIKNHRPVHIYRKPETVWNNIYAETLIDSSASTFAKFVMTYLEAGQTMIDIGCGNARDTAYFASNGINVLGIDGSSVVIDKNKADYPNIQFICLDIRNIASVQCSPNCIYMRFFIHSIPLSDASNLLIWCANTLSSGGKLFIECRSVNDPMYGKGVRGANLDEYINGHYRRFIRKDELLRNLLTLGFTIEYEIESANLSIYGDDNPVLIRTIAIKN